MDFEAELRDAAKSRKDVTALACMDGRAGLVLGMYVKGDAPKDEVELAVMSAPLLCSAPHLGAIEAEEMQADESFVASTSWVHAFVRVPEHPELLVVGLAPGGTNVTLLRSWLRDVAGRVSHLAGPS